MIRIDPTVTTTVEIDGEPITIRTMTARQRLKVAALMHKILALTPDDVADGASEEEKDARQDLVMDRIVELGDFQYEVLTIGIAEDPDTIPTSSWGAIINAVMAASKLTEDDSGN